MAKGNFIVLGDKTTCGGKVKEAGKCCSSSLARTAEHIATGDV